MAVRQAKSADRCHVSEPGTAEARSRRYVWCHRSSTGTPGVPGNSAKSWLAPLLKEWNWVSTSQIVAQWKRGVRTEKRLARAAQRGLKRVEARIGLGRCVYRRWFSSTPLIPPDESPRSSRTLMMGSEISFGPRSCLPWCSPRMDNGAVGSVIRGLRGPLVSMFRTPMIKRLIAGHHSITATITPGRCFCIRKMKGNTWPETRSLSATAIKISGF